MDTLLSFFNHGMDRNFLGPLPMEAPGLNLGAGSKHFSGWLSLDKPLWDAEKNPIPSGDEQQQSIIAYHFLEHLTAPRVPYILSECARVLVKGGTLNIVVPHAEGSLAFADLDHKSFFTERTWQTLMGNTRYCPHNFDIPLRVHFNLIMAEEHRTLCLFTQMVKE